MVQVGSPAREWRETHRVRTSLSFSTALATNSTLPPQAFGICSDSMPLGTMFVRKGESEFRSIERPQDRFSESLHSIPSSKLASSRACVPLHSDKSQMA